LSTGQVELTDKIVWNCKKMPIYQPKHVVRGHISVQIDILCVDTLTVHTGFKF
jgi:hypothetical protein